MYNMQNYNSGFGRYMPSFNAYNQPYYNYGQPYNQPQMQQPVQQNQPQQQTPIQAIRFLNADEIKGWAVQPNTSEMLVDRTNKQVTIKTADAMGESSVKTYSYTSLDEEKEQKDCVDDACQNITTDKCLLKTHELKLSDLP